MFHLLQCDINQKRYSITVRDGDSNRFTFCRRNPRYIMYDNLSQWYYRAGLGPTALEYPSTWPHALGCPWLAKALSKYYLRRVVSYHRATTIIELPQFTSAHITSMQLYSNMVNKATFRMFLSQTSLTCTWPMPCHTTCHILTWSPIHYHVKPTIFLKEYPMSHK
jgi:hypothetical protein